VDVTLPFRGAPLACQVCPSSVDFIVRMIELFCESCHEIHAVVPWWVIHSRSAPAVSSNDVVHPPGPWRRRTARDRHADLQVVPFAVKMMSRSASRIVPALVILDVRVPSPRFTRPALNRQARVHRAEECRRRIAEVPVHRFTRRGASRAHPPPSCYRDRRR